MTTPHATEVLAEEPGPPPKRVAAHAITSSALFRGEREVVIVHRDQEYRLRITKSGKLILTK